MRSTLITGLAAVSIAALAACAPGSTESDSPGAAGPTASGSVDLSTFKGKTITYLYFTDGPDEAATRGLLKEFETKSGGKVDLQIVPFADLQQSLQARLSGGNAPDVARLADLAPFRGDLMDLSGVVGKDYANEFLAGPAAAVKDGDKIVAVPNDLTMNGPFVNVDLFKKAGVPIPTKWNWDEMVAAAKKVQTANKTEAGIAIDKSGHRLSTILSQYGTTMVGKDMTNTLDEAKATKAIDSLLTLIKDGTIPKDFWIESGSKYKGANEIFLAQQAPIYISGNWQVAQFDKTAKFGWQAVPNACSERCGGFPGGKYTVGLSQSKEPQMAAALVQFLNSKESQATMDAESMWLPTRNDLIESKGVTYPTRQADMEVFAADVAETPADTFDAVASPAFGPSATVLVEEFAKAVAGQQDAATTAKNLKAGIDKVIAESK
ncbi:extracellular solute-binding protein [Knoellia sp. S7-12]|uniref:ABC transporter substrate-binding protein n=1 Tax=Knoellia sp. S7-12 TaxID=3126698 RepID=UPI003366DD24